MKTLLTTLLLILFCAASTPVEEGAKRFRLIEHLKSLPDRELMNMNAVTISTKYLYFDMSDTTFEHQNVFQIDTIIGGTQITAEFHRKYGPVDLKQLSVRNQLRADPILRPVLNRVGQFTFNQFTNFGGEAD